MRLALATTVRNVNTNTNSMDKNWNNFYGIPNGNLGDPITQGIFETYADHPISNFGHTGLGGVHHQQYNLGNGQLHLGEGPPYDSKPA